MYACTRWIPMPATRIHPRSFQLANTPSGTKTIINATIVALARLAEQRDNETGKHLERVSLYCKLLAEGLRDCGYYKDLIDDDNLRLSYLGGTLADRDAAVTM